MKKYHGRVTGPSRTTNRIVFGNESGQALVEFALVVPIFLLLVLGIVEFARAWNIYEVLTDAAREGARTAVVDDPTVTETDVVTIVQQACARAGVQIDATDVQITGFRSGRGNPTSVRVQHNHQLIWVGPFMGLATGEETLNLVTEFVMRNE